MVDTSPQKLAGLFHGLDKHFLMEQFDDKLEVQKITFLAQEFGIDLGYFFEWYIRGPYCKQVSADAHKVIDNDIKVSDLGNVGLDVEQIKSFAEILKPHLNDTDWLEIAASIIYLKKESYPEDELVTVIGYLIEDLTAGYKNFEENLVRRVIANLVELNFIH